MKIILTGANSAVGLAILRCGPGRWPALTFVPVVRSERAADEVRQRVATAEPVLRIAYDDAAGLAAAFHGASAVVHLPGVLVERPGSTYEQAHVETTRAVVDAAKRSRVAKLVLVSAIGASRTSPNRYWRTKGEAEALVQDSALPYTVLRVPLLLGPGTEGSAALKRHISHPTAWLIAGGRTMHRPLDVEDLARGVIVASQGSIAEKRTLEMVGPTALSERAMVKRAASLAGQRVRVRSIPKAWVFAVIAVRQLTGHPGLSLDAARVITAHTHVEPEPAVSALGLTLTDLDDTIRKSLAGFERERFR